MFRPAYPFQLAIVLAGLLTACSPKLDWREVRGPEALYTVTLPAKPSTLSRVINLDGEQVTMTMTAAEVDGVTYAVGTAVTQNDVTAKAALTAMKTALVRNIGGTIVREATASSSTSKAAAPSGPNAQSSQSTSIDVEARGTQGGATPQPRLLIARFIAQDNRVYQIAVVGKEKAVSRAAADTFLTSFKTR